VTLVLRDEHGDETLLPLHPRWTYGRSSVHMSTSGWNDVFVYTHVRTPHARTHAPHRLAG
jgi:hypothetical protein